ncbi:MAG TPA: hypothetical protein VGY77_03135, partial [Gemmataceae bacterium]|nr:hypothetical protein [Gemmataceae bacterium]
ATDRYTRFVLLETAEDEEPRPLLRYLARQTGLIVLRAGDMDTLAWKRALEKAGQTLLSGDMLGLTVDNPQLSRETASLFQALALEDHATMLPVFCGSPSSLKKEGHIGLTGKSIPVVIGRPMDSKASLDDVRQAIVTLRDWIGNSEQAGETPATLMIPGASSASPKGQEPSPPPHP